jgi:hypothetical protein
MWEDGEIEVADEWKSSWDDARELVCGREVHLSSLVTLSLRVITPGYPSTYLLHNKRYDTVRTVQFMQPGVFRISDDPIWASNPRFVWICNGAVYCTTISFCEDKLLVPQSFCVAEFGSDSQLLPSPISSTFAVLHMDSDKGRWIVSLLNVDTGEVKRDFFIGKSNEYILKHVQTLQCYGFHRRSCLAKDSQRGYILDFETRSIQAFTLSRSEVLNLVWM